MWELTDAQRKEMTNAEIHEYEHAVGMLSLYDGVTLSTLDSDDHESFVVLKGIMETITKYTTQ